MNTIENKAKFFAQYWGQEVFCRPHLLGTWEYTGINFDEICSEDFLRLKPLSSITDEDAIEVAKLAISQSGLKNATILFGKDVVSHIFYYEQWGYNLDLDGETCIEIYQYLQSKGYALPYMSLSVETLIEYNWIKI